MKTALHHIDALFEASKSDFHEQLNDMGSALLKEMESMIQRYVTTPPAEVLMGDRQQFHSSTDTQPK